MLVLVGLILGQLGVIVGRSERNYFMLFGCLGGVAGWVVPYVVLGSFQLSGIGLPAGLLVGMGVFLLVRAGWWGVIPERRAGGHELLLVGLFAGVIAHFVEIQFGIAAVTTRFYFWVFAGLAGAVVLQGDVGAKAEEGLLTASGGKVKEKRKKGKVAAGYRGPEAVTGVLVGLILVVVTFGLYMPDRPLLSSGILVMVCLGVWIYGAVLAAERARGDGAGGSRWFIGIRYYGAEPWVMVCFCCGLCSLDAWEEGRRGSEH